MSRMDALGGADCVAVFHLLIGGRIDDAVELHRFRQPLVDVLLDVGLVPGSVGGSHLGQNDQAFQLTPVDDRGRPFHELGHGDVRPLGTFALAFARQRQRQLIQGLQGGMEVQRRGIQDGVAMIPHLIFKLILFGAPHGNVDDHRNRDGGQQQGREHDGAHPSDLTRLLAPQQRMRGASAIAAVAIAAAVVAAELVAVAVAASRDLIPAAAGLGQLVTHVLHLVVVLLRAERGVVQGWWLPLVVAIASMAEMAAPAAVVVVAVAAASVAVEASHHHHAIFVLVIIMRVTIVVAKLLRQTPVPVAAVHAGDA
mmetsp:Transcript_26875/g.75514  ORF Transcript_26875/g.75514 Transcript_26875/m.75514 type:complete len:311 (+) Transcript_26875:2641-3573(+)